MILKKGECEFFSFIRTNKKRKIMRKLSEHCVYTEKKVKLNK